MNIIEIKNLTKKFKDVTAVQCLDMEIEKGKVIGLLGPNGAGKSTLINILCGLITKDRGEFKIFDIDSKHGMKKIKRRMGIVPQELAIYGDLTAYENVAFFASLYGVRGRKAKDKIMKALRFVGLEDKASKKASTFSGGMKRRLNIACAIAHEPELIFMDEPTVGIDPQSRNHILQSVKKLNEMGITVVYTSHYMEEVEEICSKIYIIDHGKLIAQGSREDLTALITEYKEINIKVGFVEEEEVADLKDIKGVEQVEMAGDTVAITSLKEKDNIEEIVDYFREKNIKIKNINVEVPNLETVFLSLTGRNLRD